MDAPKNADPAIREPAAEVKIDAAFRSGSLTAISIILGFSLGFMTRWAGNPEPWELIDLLAVVPLLVGIGFQVKALADFFDVSSLTLVGYTRAKNRFLIGLILVAVGVGIAILLGVYDDTLGRIVVPFASPQD